jgi:hypothetical protein
MVANTELVACDGHLLKRMAEAGLVWLESNQEKVNQLNVFPVPDGDTGTNMYLTMRKAYDEISQLEDAHVGNVSGAIARGALMGARGNSGVILSQWWRGFARALQEQPVFDSRLFAQACQSAVDMAYRGVVKPVEGTILTVSRQAMEAVAERAQVENNLQTLFETKVEAAYKSLRHTPDLLPVLKDAGVVELYIYPDYFLPLPVVWTESPAPATVESDDCWGGYFDLLRLLVGDTLRFHAWGLQETGMYVELDDQVSWHSSHPDIASLDPDGLLTASAAGGSTVTATLEALTSNPWAVEVLEEAVLVDLWIDRTSWAGVLKVGDIEQFHAGAFFDPFMWKDVTGEVEWLVSDPRVGAMSAEGLFTALAPGIVTIAARYQGTLSNQLELEVWDEVSLEYCDPANPNRALWSDAYNRVILESDCFSYPPSAAVTIRYTIEEIRPPAFGIFDPCLDLMVLDQAGQIVRSLRFDNCGEVGDIPAGAYLEFTPIYQYLTTWDLKNENGQHVPPGTYTISGRFYIYYDPVINLDITVTP